MQDEELRELKAAVFGRGAAQLPPAERAILERRLARELAVREVVPEPAGHDSSEAEPAVHDSTEAEPASSGGPDLRPQQSVEPDTPLQGPPRRLPLRMMLAAAAAGLVAIIAVGALQFAEPPRDSLAVFDAAPTSVDAAAPRWFGLDGEAEFRALGESGGHRLFAALRTVPVEGARVANRAAPAPGTDSSDAIFLHPVDADDAALAAKDQQVCLFAVHPTGSAGTCVAMAQFVIDGIVLDVPGSPQVVRFAWGPQGPVRVEDRPARET